MKTKDPEAVATFGIIYHLSYNDGQHVLPQDLTRACVPYLCVGNTYYVVWGVEKDTKKASHFHRLAVKGGLWKYNAI